MTRPLSFPRARPLLAAAVLLAALLATSCTDATAPDGSGGTITSGQTVSGRVGVEPRGTRLRYVAQADEVLRMSFRAWGDSIRVRVVRTGGDTIVLVDARHHRGDSISVDFSFIAGRQAGAAYFLIDARPGGGGTFRFSLTGQNREPESRSATIQLDEVVEERFDDENDADVYELTLAAPADVVLYGTLLDVGATTPSIVILGRLAGDDATGFPNGVSVTMGSDAAAADVASPRVTLPAGTWRFSVTRGPVWQPPPQNVRYRLQVRRVDTGPEDRAAVLAAGDTVASAIDYRGDLDEYVVRGSPGDTVVGFIQSTGDHPVSFGVRGDPWWDFVAGAIGMPLLRTTLGRRAIPASGELRLQVEGGSGMPLRGSAGYRLFVFRADSLPESGVATIALGDSLSGRIDAPGDIDAYQLVLTQPTMVVATLERASGGGAYGAYSLTVARGAIGYNASFSYPPSDSVRTGTGRMLLLAGTYSIRVGERVPIPSSYVGPYTLRTYPVDTLPETRDPAIAIGDTITGEAIDHAGDRDLFTFQAAAGDTIVARIRATVAGTSGVYMHLVRPATGAIVAYVNVASPEGGAVTPRLTIPETGTYALSVGGVGEGRAGREHAPYRATLERFSSLPESVPAQFALGDTLRGERLDYLGDVDAFVLTAPAGRELMVAFRSINGGTFFLRAFDDATGVPLDSQASAGYPQRMGRITVPASGRIRLQMSEYQWPCGFPGCQLTFYAQGAYWITSYLVDRAPEGETAAYAVGGTLDSSIDPEGDVDEYTFSGAGGDRLLLQFDVPMGTWGQGGLRGSVIDPATGEALATIAKVNGSGLQDGTLAFTLPRAGTYTLRVEGTLARDGRGRYSMRVQAVP